jgi:hypothetical protein
LIRAKSRYSLIFLRLTLNAEAIADVRARYKLPERYVVYVGSLSLAKIWLGWLKLGPGGSRDCSLAMSESRGAFS